MKKQNYYIYFITNPSKTTLYLGVTNNLARRINEHYENRGNDQTWAGRYNCYDLIYYEQFSYIDKAIAREKQLKKWSRKKKEWLIGLSNPHWNVLNSNFPYQEDSSTRFPRSKLS